jgi:hypothetical protein
MSIGKSSFRPGNRALGYLAGHDQPMDAKIASLVESIPNLAAELYDQAESVAKSLRAVQSRNLLSRLLRTVTGSASSKQTLLARCVFDLMLSVSFQEIFEYSGDKELSSLIVDSILYQATGCEASTPTDADIFDYGTQNARGIHKFLLGRQQMKHIGDIAAWLFGKEVAALQGNPKDIAIILSVSALSIFVRVHAKWTTRYCLYGTLPSEAEKRAFEATLKEQNQKLLDMLN